MESITSECFDPNKDCGTLCLQHKTSEVFWEIYKDDEILNVYGNNPNYI